MRRFSFVAPTCSADGYGTSAEGLILSAVRDHDAEIDFVTYPWDDPRFMEPELHAMIQGTDAIGLSDTSVIYFLPFALQRCEYRSQCTLSQTMWETDRLPSMWAGLLNAWSDGVIVPSEHCRAVFAEQVEKPIMVAPYGTDPDLYEYVERSPDDETTIFLMAGALHYRKGVDFALQAFREEFAPYENVELWLKTRLHFLDPGVEGRVLADPRVKVIREDYSRDRMANLYQSVDCLLAPSRGEGSGLTPRDAMATGLPVIMTDWGGLAEIADARYGYPVDVVDLEPAPLINSSYDLNVHHSSDLGSFARPSVPQIREAMRAVHTDRAAAYARGREAADWMRREWTWEHCSLKWLRAIEMLSAVPA